MSTRKPHLTSAESQPGRRKILNPLTAAATIWGQTPHKTRLRCAAVKWLRVPTNSSVIAHPRTSTPLLNPLRTAPTFYATNSLGLVCDNVCSSSSVKVKVKGVYQHSLVIHSAVATTLCTGTVLRPQRAVTALRA